MTFEKIQFKSNLIMMHETVVLKTVEADIMNVWQNEKFFIKLSSLLKKRKDFNFLHRKSFNWIDVKWLKILQNEKFCTFDKRLKDPKRNRVVTSRCKPISRKYE